MPRGHHVIDLIVMTGHVKRSTAGSLYAPLALTISRDSFWNGRVQEVYVTEDGDIELTPSVGNHTIILGDTSKLEDKLSRMKTFYTEGLDKAGWNKYKTISLKYDDQVICTRRN